jgi:hypothetical protein
VQVEAKPHIDRGIDMTILSRRAVLVVVGGAAASAAAARVTMSRGPSSSPVTRGRGQQTSFGSVALLASSRLALSPSTGTSHQHHKGSTTPVPSAVHGAWTDAVMVEVEVHNGSQRAIELSPGQFRMRVDGDGPTVSLYRADRVPGAMAPRSTTTMRISYLAPPPDHPLSLEFADAGAMTTLGLGSLAEGIAS